MSPIYTHMHADLVLVSMDTPFKNGVNKALIIYRYTLIEQSPYFHIYL